jgi:hypothetical protein
MLLSAVSVLAVALPSSEIPEGRLNYSCVYKLIRKDCIKLSAYSVTGKELHSCIYDSLVIIVFKLLNNIEANFL